MNRKVGFIGLGNMASAIIGGVTGADLISRSEIIGSARTLETLDKATKELGISTTTDNKAVAAAEKLVFLCVKPKNIPEVIEEIKDVVKDDVLIISIAAGVTLDKLGEAFGRKLKIVRVMPNIAALVGSGMSGISANKNVSEDELNYVTDIFSCLGHAQIVKEQDMDVVTSLAGGGPAFVAMFIEALADGAVADGMRRDDAYEFAARTVQGAAKMIARTGMHPGELKDKVCSPGGTTIEGTIVLEKNNFRGATIDAVRACTKKSRDMASAHTSH